MEVDLTNSKGPALNTALLIDGENISSAMASKLLSVARRFGDVVINRVYGNFANLKGWSSVAGVRIVHSGSGKNAADIALALDAVELSFERKVDVFVLASSDGDFVHVATRLRERGFKVVGLGEIKAPDSFRQACSQWVPVETMSVAKPSVSVSATPQQVKNCVTTFKDGAVHSELRPQTLQSSAQAQHAKASFDEEVLRIVGEHPQGITTSEINKIVRAAGIGKISEQTQKTWASYFKAREEIFDIAGKGQQALVTAR
jgi:hypothetical protein